MNTTTITSPTSSMMSMRQGINIPAMRGMQGDRPMYLLLVTNSVLMRNFAAEAEVADQSGNKVQRSLDKRHAGDIVSYIVENPADYILGAMTYAIDRLDDASFIPVEEGANIGLLVLPMDAKLRCLDGQHRRQALHDAALQDDEVLDDYSAIVLYVEDDYTKRRQMFSDMNATPKVVSKALNITFDTRDPYARAAQLLAKSHPLLHGMVETVNARITAKDPKFFSLSGIYDGLKRFDLGKVLPRGRSPKNRTDQELLAIGTEMFDVISDARPELVIARERILEAEDTKEAAKVLSSLRVLSILASTTTLRVIAGALHEVMKKDNQSNVKVYRDKLAAVDFSPQSQLFLDADFIGRNGTPQARNQEVLAATEALTAALRLT